MRYLNWIVKITTPFARYSIRRPIELGSIVKITADMKINIYKSYNTDLNLLYPKASYFRSIDIFIQLSTKPILGIIMRNWATHDSTKEVNW
jgi:hypothetical protein